MATDALAIDPNEPEVTIPDEGDQQARIQRALARVRPTVALAQSKAEEAAEEALEGERAMTVARSVGTRVKDLAIARDRAIRVVGMDVSLSAKGKQERVQAARAEFATALTRIGNEIETSLFLLEGRHVRDSLPAAKPEIEQEVSNILLAAPGMLAGDVLQEAADVLSEAVDTESDVRRLRANVLLQKAYGRILPRWASLSAPKYTAAWSGLAAELVDLMRAHLDVATDGPMSRRVEGFAEKVRGEWSFLRNSVERSSEWPAADVLLGGVPLLAGEEG